MNTGMALLGGLENLASPPSALELLKKMMHCRHMDVVVNDDSFKKKLIFTNTSNATNSRIYESIIKEVQARTSERGEEFTFSITQVRNKLKKLISECKKVALTTSTASGINRFQDKYGKWFQLLYPIVKQREFCDPTQSL